MTALSKPKLTAVFQLFKPTPLHNGGHKIFEFAVNYLQFLFKNVLNYTLLVISKNINDHS